MTVLGGSIYLFARAYARHAGLDVPDEELRAEIERRAASVPWFARALAGGGAIAIRWLLPLILRGRPYLFDELDHDDAEALLLRLQFSGNPLLRGGYAAVKVLVLPACYGRREHLESLGYSVRREGR